MVEHTCIHEDQLQDHSLQIQKLTTKSDYKEHRQDVLEQKMEKMDEKLDVISQTLNDIKIESNRDDTQLELRLKTIETELNLMKEQQKKDKEENQKRLTNYFAVLTISLTVVSILINYLLK